MKSSIFFLTALLAFTTSVHGLFNVSYIKNTIPTGGSMFSAQLDNSLYLFGGENDTLAFGNELYKLTLTDNTFNWEIISQIDRPHGAVNGQGYMTSDNQNMVIMGGVTADNNVNLLNLQIYTYNFASQTWTANSNNNAVVNGSDTSVLSNRESFSATYDPNTQKTYVFGGCLSASGYMFSDFRVLDANFKVASLNSPNVARYGHSASLTSDGKIVVLGGVVSSTNGNILASMETAWVYTLASNTWAITNTTTGSGSNYPSARSGHTAVINSDDQITIFGGDSSANKANKQYTNSIAILDTKTWTWTIPSVSGTPPSSRSYASGGILDGKTLTVAFGESANAFNNDINVYDVSTSSWLEQFSKSSSNSSSGESSTDNNIDKSSSNGSSGVSTGVIAGVTVAAVVVVLVIAFLLWKFKCCSVDRSWLKDRSS